MGEAKKTDWAEEYLAQVKVYLEKDGFQFSPFLPADGDYKTSLISQESPQGNCLWLATRYGNFGANIINKGQQNEAEKKFDKAIRNKIYSEIPCLCTLLFEKDENALEKAEKLHAAFDWYENMWRLFKTPVMKAEVKPY